MHDVTCPKCGGTMRTYERSTITVDQCADCRGIFLDRGELDRLIDLELGAAARPVGSGWEHRHDGYGHSGHHTKKHKESFWSELFDD